ncbi:MAG: peptidoglycan DD-metalloendopeptidase family protein [Bacillota bacterium]
MSKSVKLIYILIPIFILITIISFVSNSNSNEKANHKMIANIELTNEVESNDLGFEYQKLTAEDNNQFLATNSSENFVIAENKNLFNIGRIKNEIIEKNNLLKNIKTHEVKKGETLWSIAHKYDINIDTLIGANDISNMNRIKPGEEIMILPVKGILYNISPGENLSSIAKKFDITKEKIINNNGIKNPEKIQTGKTLLLPGVSPEFSYQDRLDQMFIPPVNARISSHYGQRWGRMHEGIDYAVNPGTGIKAAGGGRIIYSGWSSGYGLLVIIQHQKGLKTLYAHNSKILVNNGEYVHRGEIIARSGNTGNSTGPHLHFEVQVNGRPANPLNYLRSN